ncbi:MAG: redoxin family protein [Kiritimatiellia bacterium]
MQKLLPLLSAALLSAALTSAQAEHALKIGDAAPPLKVGKWIKGDPVKALEAGKLHVLEFWATWCGPCVAAIPHVSELQKKHADVVFIGVNVWEDDPEKVEGFVKDMGDKMNYRVVLDDVPAGADKGAMAETWLEAAGQNGIPCSFLVGKDGKILWVGHPMQLEGVLDAVLAGTFDPEKQKAEAEKESAMEKKFADALDGVNSPEDALAALEKLGKDNPELAAQTTSMRFGIMISALKDYDGAYKLAAQIAETSKDDAQSLNELAWMILTAPGLEKRDIALATKMAERAVEVSKGEDAAILDTLARAFFEAGRAKAIETQKKAIEKADDDSKDVLQAALDAYTEFDPHTEGNPEDDGSMDEPGEDEGPDAGAKPEEAGDAKDGAAEKPAP